MTATTIHDIIIKITGPVGGIGKTEVDEERLENLEMLIEVTDRLLFSIDRQRQYKESTWASLKVIGERAERFFRELKDSDL